MARKKGDEVEGYRFDPRVERALVALVCSRPRVFGRIGHALEPDAMPTEAGQLAVRAAQAIAKDTGSGPDSELLVIQRLSRWMEDGKVTYEQRLAVSDMIEDAMNAGLPGEEGIVNEVAAVLRVRLHHEAAIRGLDSYSNHTKPEQLEEVIGMMQRVRTLGDNDVSVGVRIGDASFGVIDRVRHMERLPTGITELDVMLGGGMPRQQEGVLVGGSGDGKSMGLSHIAARSSLAGLSVAYASAELPVETVLARIKANMTAVPINEIMEGSTLTARERLAKLSYAPCYVKWFTPEATTVDEITEWVKACEDHCSRPIDLLVVDYADKLTAKSTGKKDEGSYTVMRKVYEALRLFAVEKNRWVWTASQARRANKDQKKRMELEDVADSMHKVRVADLVITLNAREEGTEMLFNIAKNRTGKSRVSVGPIPVDFARGQMAVRPWENAPQGGLPF